MPAPASGPLWRSGLLATEACAACNKMLRWAGPSAIPSLATACQHQGAFAHSMWNGRYQPHGRTGKVGSHREHLTLGSLQLLALLSQLGPGLLQLGRCLGKGSLHRHTHASQGPSSP